MARKRIQRSDLFRILWRSFLIQGSWSFQGMLGLGFCYCTLPIARRLFKEQEKQQNFCSGICNFSICTPIFRRGVWALWRVWKKKRCTQTMV